MLCYKLLLYYAISMAVELFELMRYDVLFLCLSPYQKYDLLLGAVVSDYISSLGILVINYIIFRTLEAGDLHELETKGNAAAAPFINLEEQHSFPEPAADGTHYNSQF